MEKTIKYLENGEYHYATVRSVGDLAQLKTNSKETLVEAINELWNGGGNADPSKAPKPEGYDQLVQDVADAVKNQQEINQQWTEWQKEDAQLTEERKQAYLQAMKEMQESVDKAKADAAALDKKLQEGVDTLNNKTSKLDEEITKTFSDLDTSIQNMHEQLQREADSMNQDLINTKSDLTKVRTDLQNAQMDNGKIHDELTNINGKFEHKVWQTDLDPLKEQIDRAETSVQQTKDELLGKASRQDLDTVTNTVSKLDTQLKETAKGVEISVKKDELGGEIAEALTNKTNILLGTRRFTTNNWQQREHVEMCSDPWKGFLVAKQNSPIEGIQQAYDVKAGTTYTFSLFAKMDTLDDSNKPQIILAKNNLDTSLDTKIDVWRKEIEDITSDFKRYDLTFTPSEDCTIYPHVISNSNNPIFVCGYQLEIGKTSTPWEPNQEDVGDYVEKSEAQFNVYNDKIQALTEKQRQQGDTQERLRTEVTQTAEGTRQVSENLKKTNDDITKLRGEFEVKADHMKSEYETYTNKAVGQISDSTLNLIRNSSFQNKDEDFAQWQNISAKANVRSDENGLRWVELTQSGLTTNNPEGITSNYFNIKQGKVTVAVDIKSGDKASLDNDSVLSLELYNDVKKRVDFYDVSLSQLGLSKELLGDHKVHRGLYRLGIDRNDAKYMTVKAKLVKNGDLYFTNFSARLSSIDDGAYEPNPDDLNQQILKQNTKIEQNAKEVAIKANSVDVTRDIKSAVDGIQVGGANLIKNSETDIVIESKTTDAWPAWCNKAIYWDLTPGETYTFSVSATNTNNVQEASMRIWNSASNKEVGSANFYFLADGKRHSKTFTIPKDGTSYSVWLYAGHMGKIEGKSFTTTFHHPQLELGNKSTSWSPAPEDISTEIKSAKDAAIQVASDQINLHVNEISTQFDDKLNKRINEQKTASEKFTSDGIEQVVTKVTNVKNDVDRLGDKVDGIQVGGRNLAKETNIDIVIDDTSNTGTQGWCFKKIYLTSQPKIGDQITVSSEGTLTGKGDLESYQVVLWNETTTDQRSNAVLMKAGERSSRTLTVNYLGGKGETVLLVYSGKAGDTQGKKLILHHLKVENGNKSTDWTPAPEDTSEEIKSAKEAAIKVSSDKIDLQVQEITGKFNDKLNKSAIEIKSASEKFTTDGIEQTVTKITNVKNDVDRLGDKVDSFGGGINLVKETSELEVSGRSYAIKDYNFAEPLEPNTKYTISVEAKVDQTALNHKQFVFIDPYTNGWSWGVQMNCTPANLNYQYYRYTFTTPDASKKVTNISVYLAHPDGANGGDKDNISGIGYFRKLKVEKGEVATPWTPYSQDINKKIDTQTFDSANIDEMRTQGHYFVKNLTGNPVGGWVYVDVTGNNNDRIRQDVYQDSGSKHMYRRWFGTYWTGWEQGAYLSDVNNVKTEVTASVNNLGDRVTTEVNSVETRVNNKIDGIQVGGRNILSNTENLVYKAKVTNSTNNPNSGDSMWKLAVGNLSDWLRNNPDVKEIAISYNYELQGATPTGTIRFGVNQAPAWEYMSGFNLQGKPAKGRVKLIVPVTDNMRETASNISRIRGDGLPIGATLIISHPKWEVGNKATDWSPAPEDTVEAIKELNTKWDVANGQIQGKVTATDVNNILNGKGYATQSWAQTMFQMKSDSITLQAVRDNITNGIQNQLNDTRNQLNNMQVGGRNYLQESDKLVTGWGQDLGTIPSEALNSLAGKTITVSADVEWNNFKSDGSKQNRLGFEASVTGSDGHGYWLGTWKTPTTARGKERISTQYSLPAGVTFTVNNNGQNGYVSINGSGKVSHVKIEVGNKATDWTPAPTDDVGTNLLKGTADFSGNWKAGTSNSNELWKHESWIDPNGNQSVFMSKRAWNGCYQPLWLDVGIYTFSCYYYISGVTKGASVYTTITGDNQVELSSYQKEIDSTKDKWNKAEFTFYVTKAGNSELRVELYDENATLHIASYKLEKGSVATPWTPNPQDAKTYTDSQITNTNKKIDTQVLDSANVDDLKNQGHYFVKNLANSPIAGWVYVDVTGNNNDRLKQEVYQDNGYEHRSRRWYGSYWTEWTTDVNNKNVISQINITPDQIKIASNKIVIDGNTDIHGDLRTDRVRLVGKHGAIDMTGDVGIKLTNDDGSSMLLGRSNIDLMYKNDFRMNIDSSLMTIYQRNQFTTQKNPIAILNIGSSWNHSNNKVRGADIRYNPGNVNDEQLHGADYLSLSYNKPNLSATEANIHPQITLAYQDLNFDSTHRMWKKGVNINDDLTLGNFQRINVGVNDKNNEDGKWTNDPLMISRGQWNKSSQADRYQPTIRLGYDKDNMGSAGVTFLWNQVKPFGNRDISDLGDIWFNGQRFVFGWASHKSMFDNQDQPAFMRLDDKGGIMSGIAFTPGSTWDLGSGAWNISLAMMALKDRGII